MRYIINLVLCILLCSCQKSALDRALELAGENVSELQQVMDYYSNNPADSLKYRAAVFLIENMPGHFSFGGASVDSFYTDVDSLIKTDINRLEPMRNAIDSLALRYGLPGKAIKMEDVNHITADYLIANIEAAFRVWPRGGFAQHLSFDEFCELILPYRVGNEPLESWRDSVGKEYDYLSTMGYHEGWEYSAYNACCEVNNKLKEEAAATLYPFNVFEVERYSTMRKLSVGSCQNHTAKVLFAMRAKGIPVTVDFTPQWAYRDMGHSWDVLLNNHGKEMTFSGADLNPDIIHKPDSKMAKVYRRCYARNRLSLGARADGEEIPADLSSPFIIDVTSKYMKTCNIDVPIKNARYSKRKFGYLCVFDNKGWKPIAYGDINGRSISFREIGRETMYLPAYFVAGQPISANYPFSIDYNGNIHYYVADTINTRKLRIFRKYPTTHRVTGITTHMIGGEIQASADSTFSNPVIFHRIEKNPNGMYVTVTNDSVKGKYRYWRHLSPIKGYGNIAELQFFDERDSLLNRYGRIIGTDGSWGNPGERDKTKAFDGDPLSFFDCIVADSAWVGLEFSKPVNISKVTYLPRNDGNNIEIGDKYELFYYDANGWVSLGLQTATKHYVEYDGVPDNAVLWLHNHSRGKEERIFTFDGRKAVWW